MFKIIGGDGREYGPVSAAQIESWIAQNRANGQTQVKAEGTTDWRPLADFPEFAAWLKSREPGAAAPPAASDVFTESAQGFAPATGPAANPVAAARRSVGRDHRLGVLATLSRAWEIVTSRFLLTVGCTTLVTAATFLVGLIPGAGMAVRLLLTQVIVAGLFWLMLRVARDENAEFADAFGGFTRAIKPLALLSLITAVVQIFFVLLAASPILFKLVALGGPQLLQSFAQAVSSNDPEALARIDFSQLVGPALLFPVLVLPLVYLSTAWIFAPLLIVDRGLGCLEALRLSWRVANRQWFRLFFLQLAFVPLVIAGAFCFLVGVLVVLAVFYAAIAAAYETAFAEAGSPDDRPPH
jgi:uncharacterized membrane protein